MNRPIRVYLNLGGVRAKVPDYFLTGLAVIMSKIIYGEIQIRINEKGRVMEIEKVVDVLAKSAREKGTSSVKLIPAKDIAVNDYVRMKCKFGCDNFAKRFTCPPYAPAPKETRELLKDYNWAILVEFTGLIKKADQLDVHRMIFELEREAFLNGLHKAFGFAAGPCKLCESCPAEEIENPSEYSKKYCRNPDKARPSMEACGIDIFKTARDAGFEINVVKGGETFKSFALLLLE